MESDPDRVSELLSEIEASDAILAEETNAADPVAHDRITDALIQKAMALKELERFEEAAVVWGDLLDFFPDADDDRLKTLGQQSSDLTSADRHDGVPAIIDELISVFVALGEPDELSAIAGRALRRKAYCEEALGFPESVVARTRADLIARVSELPGASESVAWALRQDTIHLLEAPGQLDAAIASSEILRKRLLTEPDETLEAVAGTVIGHVEDLIAGGLSRRTTYLAVIAVDLAIVAAESTATRLTQILRGRIKFQPVAGTFKRVMTRPASIDRGRRCAEQVLAVSRTLIERLRDTENPELERWLAGAQVRAFLALVWLGHPGDGMDALSELGEGDTTDIARLFQTWAEQTSGSGATVARLSNLRLRAQLLGRGDDAIAQAAFEESLRASDPAHSRSWLTKVYAQILKFQSSSEISVPDHPPDSDLKD